MCIGHVKSGSWQAPGQAFGNTFVYMVNAEAVAGQRIQPVVVRVDADRNQQIEFWKPTGRTIKMRGCCRGKRYGIFKPSSASGADAAAGPAGERKGTDSQSAVCCYAGPGDVQSLFGI